MSTPSVLPAAHRPAPAPAAAFFISASNNPTSFVSLRPSVTYSPGSSSVQPKPRRPKKLPRRVKLDSLPVEILALIASHLLPPTRRSGDLFPSPDETPYPPNKPSNTGVRNEERLGSVPSGVADVIAFAKCCRLTMRAAGALMASFGGSLPPAVSKGGRAGKTRTIDEEGRDKKPELERVDKRVLYVQVEHCDDNADNIRELLLQDRDTLEELVFYKCPEGHLQSRGFTRIATSLAKIKPLQHDLPEDEIAFPRLRRLQIGPKLCRNCTTAALRIMCANEFAETKDRVYDKKTDKVRMKLFRNAGYGQSDLPFQWTLRTYEAPASPKVKVLEIYIPATNPETWNDEGEFTSLARQVHNDIAQGLQGLSVIARGLGKVWGGFGCNGGSTSVMQKKTTEVEKELAEFAEKAKQMMAPVKRKQAIEERDRKKVEDKYKAQLKALLAGTRKGSTAASTSGPAKVVRKTATTEPTPACLAEIGDDQAESTSGNSVTARALEVKQEPPSDEDDPTSDTDSPHRRSNSLSTTRSADDTHVSRYARSASQANSRATSAIRMILNRVAMSFPGITALRVLRNGSSRLDIVQSVKGAEEYAEIYTRPLRDMKNLSYLDLGLAIVGQAEVRDFPLGVSIFDSKRKSNTGMATGPADLNLRRKKWNLMAEDAIREGDSWRRTILERFVLGKRERVSPLHSGTNVPNGNSSDLDDDEDADQPESDDEQQVVRWPSSLQRGHVYTVDLVERAKRRAILVEWTRHVEDGKETIKMDKRKIQL